MPDEHRDNPLDDRMDGRDESPAERADRNWSEVLQELRVLQTGTQILTGFLLALAFQPAFAEVTGAQRDFYLALIVLAALSSIVALAPVALHRVVFRQGVKPAVVRYGHVALITALGTVSVLIVGVVAFVFDVVVGGSAFWWAFVLLAAAIVALWLVVPGIIRVRARSTERGR
ncbi:sodium:proton antiporter [Microbacterium sp. NEAU-LLC]|uniref:Sodium:proton antiporter n=1 Tax=Microbacterium helvum TaxID=2773713 RepID=A0ABR8NM20_9MICO|nr:DUF6328 family protein [Microbacterium helvum]MBD3941720.1 sodium:proton antiporter [Microbacterium helvum]